MRTERRVSYETDEDIKIHDLNDLDSGMLPEQRSGQTDRISESGRRRAGDAGKGRYRPEKKKTRRDRTPESRITMKNRRRKRRRTVFSVCLFLLALTALAGCFVLAMENRQLHDEVQVAMAYVDEVNSITTYTEEEVRKMTADAAAKAAEQSSLEKEKEILDDIRSRMESGDGTAPMLRAIYKNELVVADDGRYYFFPIVDTLKRHSYQADHFQMNEEDILEYWEDGNVVSKKGIDVSRYQEDINWKKVAADGVEYAFIRLGIRGASEGKLVIDAKYEDNIEGALKNDVEVGVYFFTQALTKEEAVEEAEFVLEHMEGYDVTYPVVLDVEEVTTKDPRTEDMTKQERTDVCIAFCERIKAAGYTPMIYGNLKTFLLMVDMEQLEEYEKWFAFYQTPLYFPYEFSIWQYTSAGSVDGIKGDVDMNVSLKDWNHE
jgi:Lyzozyme M1 (1,4-beta-N-acetylmuramidase)